VVSATFALNECSALAIPGTVISDTHAASTNGLTFITHPFSYLDIDSSDGESYTDWKIALSKEGYGFGLELAYTDTDLSDTECGGDVCDGRALFTVSRSF